LGFNVPWHISRFFPAYNMKDIPPTPLKTMQKAKHIGLKAGLLYVYLGNIESNEGMYTKCPQCGQVLISRSYFGIMENNIVQNKCPNCGEEIAGVGMTGAENGP